jgi:hypothetical protein
MGILNQKLILHKINLKPHHNKPNKSLKKTNAREYITPQEKIWMGRGAVSTRGAAGGVEARRVPVVSTQPRVCPALVGVSNQGQEDSTMSKNQMLMSVCAGFSWALEHSPNEASVNLSGVRLVASKTSPALIKGKSAKGTVVEFVTTSSGNVPFPQLPAIIQEAIKANLEKMEKGAKIVVHDVTVTRAVEFDGETIEL